MSKDYKSNPEKKPTPAPGWAWALAGLLIGLFIGFLIYLAKAVPVPEKKTAPSQTQSKQAPPQKQKTVAPTKEKEEESRFSFYSELPRMVIEVPDTQVEQETKTNRPNETNKAEIETPPARTISTPKAAQTQTAYILQVGSFRSHREADSLKARLAFMGLQAKMQTVTVNNNQRWIRVRVGPFPSLKRAEQVQARLKRNKIAAILLKLSS